MGEPPAMAMNDPMTGQTISVDGECTLASPVPPFQNLALASTLRFRLKW
jgi:hypothetical protein